jgi:hypothetical protein
MFLGICRYTHGFQFRHDGIGIVFLHKELLISAERIERSEVDFTSDSSSWRGKWGWMESSTKWGHKGKEGGNDVLVVKAE